MSARREAAASAFYGIFVHSKLLVVDYDKPGESASRLVQLFLGWPLHEANGGGTKGRTTRTLLKDDFCRLAGS